MLVSGLLIISGCQTSSQTPIPLPLTETSTLESKLVPTSTPTASRTPVPSETPVPTETPVPSNTPLPPTKTPRPTATPIPLPEGVEAVSLKTGDGFELVGFLHTPENPVTEPIAVLLAHEYYSSYQSWETFAERLVEAGFTTLSFDFRGHGDSPGTKDFSAVGMDVKAAIRYLNQQGFEQIICMGASMGGTGCMAAATEMELIGLANLSGPQDLGAGRLVSREDLKNMTIPKIFMIAEEDQAGSDFVADFIEMAEMAAEPKDFYLYPGYAHASGLLFFEFGEEVQEILLNFVKGFSQSAQE
jgi:pimeloyl-ACP methyl ester carboxylesterase